MRRVFTMPFESDRCRIVGRDEIEPKTHWASIYIAAALSFVGAVQFSLYFSALWPYMKKIDPGISEGFFGLTVALYSLGQVISAPAFGAWSNRIKQVKKPLTLGLFLMFVGNLIYIFMEILPFQRRYILLICRFVVGMGSGNVALLRSYAATASHKSDRSRAIAFVTCGQAVGMTLGPAFQLFFTPFPYPGISIFGLFHLNLYTLPAYLACTINVIGVVTLYKIFEENYCDIVEEEKPDEEEGLSSQNRIQNLLPAYDMLAVLICYFTRFIDMFSRTTMETLGSPYSMMMFALDSHRAVKFVSIAQGLVGATTLLTYLAYIFGNLEQYIPMRAGCITSIVFIFIFYFITYAWPFLPNYVEKFSYNNTPNALPVGCDMDRFDWCDNLTAVNMWVFYGSYVILIGIAFPVITITLNVLFSRILGPRRQGTEQGIFQASSAAARMIGPIGNTMLYTYEGPRAVWILEMVVIAASLLCWFGFYNRMVDLKIPPPEERPQRTEAFGFHNPQCVETDEDEI
ncbi:hypothetical protein M3Y97_00758200 [Aphelenchoides bicaudatus]|nr:hypothetical protein M3Y97_00758200 [Aphelenchoides bicaudatus]